MAPVVVHTSTIFSSPQVRLLQTPFLLPFQSANPQGAAFARLPRCAMAALGDGGSGRTRMPHVLTVAGSDSGAGAGIQADLKACGALGAYCSTVITAVTAQNTVGVQGVHLVPEEFISRQLNSVLSDMEVDVVKTGMLPSVGIIKILSNKLKEYHVRALVVDPVMVATSGDVLSSPSTLSGYKKDLFPLADLLTPNLKEASILLGSAMPETVADMCEAARALHRMGPKNVLLKGGHLSDPFHAIDVFFNGKEVYELKGTRVETRNTHGTGCTLSSCIAAELAKGSKMLQAVQAAKNFVENALLHSKDLAIGGGMQGPFDHLFQMNVCSFGLGNKIHFNPESLLLYAVTDSGMNKRWGRSIIAAVTLAIEGGATIVQLREKEAETLEFLQSAKACLDVCHSKGVPLLINDRVDIALACNADGVHVGQTDMPVSMVRHLLGPNKIIGVSCKTQEQAHLAWVDGADYIGSGGVFPTNTKAGNQTIGLEGLKTVCFSSKLPVVAIGGIKVDNAKTVMGIGAPNLKGVAVVSGLFDQECVLSETRRFRAILTDSTAT